MKYEEDLNSEELDVYKCYEFPEGYYLDYSQLFYRLCYSTCKTCNISGIIIINKR